MKKIILIVGMLVAGSVLFAQRLAKPQHCLSKMTGTFQSNKEKSTAPTRTNRVSGDIIFEEYFNASEWSAASEGGVAVPANMPAGWTVLDATGNNWFWRWSTEGPRGYYTNSAEWNVPNPNWVIKSTSDNTPGGEQGFIMFELDFYNCTAEGEPTSFAMDSYIQFPVIEITENDVVNVRFEQFHRFCCGNYNTEVGPKLYISHDYTNWVRYDVEQASINAMPNNPSVYEIPITNIAANQSTVYVRLHIKGMSYYYWMVDDFVIYEPMSYDARIEGYWVDYSKGKSVEYYTDAYKKMFVGTPYFTPYHAFQKVVTSRAIVNNFGAQAFPNAQITTKVVKEDGTVINESSSGVVSSIASGQTDTSFLATHDFQIPRTEESVGAYYYEGVVSGSEEDNIPENNTYRYDFHITENVFGYANPLTAGSDRQSPFSYTGTADGDGVGVIFHLNKPTDTISGTDTLKPYVLEGINVYITDDSYNYQIWREGSYAYLTAQVYESDFENGSFDFTAPIVQSVATPIDSSMANTWVHLPFVKNGASENVTPDGDGQEYLAMILFTTGNQRFFIGADKITQSSYNANLISFRDGVLGESYSLFRTAKMSNISMELIVNEYNAPPVKGSIKVTVLKDSVGIITPINGSPVEFMVSNINEDGELTGVDIVTLVANVEGVVTLDSLRTGSYSVSATLVNENGDIVYNADGKPIKKKTGVTVMGTGLYETTIVFSYIETPVTDVQAILSGSNVIIAWEAPASEAEHTYTITKNGAVLATGHTKTYYTDANVSNGTYEYCVKAVYANSTTEPVCATPIAVCYPARNVQAVAEDTNVNITWNAPAIASDYTYTITKNGTEIATGVTETSYTDNDVANGTYEYCVKVVYANGTSEPACATPVTIFHHATNVQAISEGSNVSITWNAPTIAGVYTYTIIRNGAIIATGITETNYTDASVVSGTYEYCVKVVYANGTSEPVCATPIDIYYPVTNVQAVVEGSGVSIAWNTPIIAGGYTYIISRNGVEIATTVAKTTYTDNDVTNGTYEYCVKVVYASGISEPVCATPVTINLVTFAVVDSVNNPIKDATVTINEATLTTNALGVATICLGNGIYPYTVSKDGFVNVAGNVAVNEADTTINVTLILQEFTLTLTKNPAEGGSINDDVNGVYHIGDTITVIATPNAGYQFINWTENGSQVSTDAQFDYIMSSENVTLTANFAAISSHFVIFTIAEDVTNNPINGATITINGVTLTTNASGVATTAFANGEYSYAVTKAGYTDTTGTATVNGASISIDVKLIPKLFTVTFQVVDATNNSIGDATVMINEDALTTNSSGVAEIQLKNGTYPYTVSKNGFVDMNGSAVVDGSNLQITVTLQDQIIAPYNVNAEVVNTNQALVTWNTISEFSDGFEDYEDFIIANIGNYTLVDVDGSATYAATAGTFPNSRYVGSYIVFNPTTAGSGFTGSWAPHGGSKYLACFSATTPPNNDWLITHRVTVFPEMEFSFWARSLTSQSGADRFKVGISTTGTTLTDFTFITGSGYIEAPAEWTQYTYSLDAYVGQQIYLAINCVSNDAHVFMIDDLFIGSLTVENSESLLGYKVYLNDEVKAEGLTTTQYTITDIPVGTHAVGVQSVYASGSSEIVYANPITIVQQYSLTLESNPTEGGTVNSEVSGNYEVGSAITVEAVPADGYKFVNWTKDGVEVSGNAQFEYTMPSENVTLVANFEQICKVTFTVVDSENNPVKGAQVGINSYSLITNNLGIATINLTYGTYAYTISKFGFVSVTDSVEANGTDTTVNVILNRQKHTITFTVVDNSSNPIEDATIIINSDTLTTNTSGVATIELVNGTYPYTISKAGYANGIGSVLVNGADIQINKTLVLQKYIVTFTVVDSANDPVQGATVAINQQTLTTNASGVATIALVNGTYSYTISKADYVAVADSVVIAGADIQINKTLTPQEYTVTFTVVDNASNPIEGATVVINNETLTTNTSGVATIELINSTYLYTIFKAGYIATTDSVEVDGADIQVNKTLTPQEYTVTFTVVDNASNPIEGATVAINNETLTTNTSGVATIELVNGTYSYTISKADYVAVADSVVIAGADIQINKTLTPQEYTVTFTVVDNASNPIEGATVAINNETLTTNASGVATIELVNGTYPYTIFKACYIATTDSVEVDGADIQVNITLTPQEYTVTFTVVDNASNPIEGATVAINNETLTTNDSGVATIALVNGTYPYTISKAGYVSVTGDAVVNGADIQVNKTLNPQEYTVTFTVVDNASDPIQGATIAINNETLTTNDSGVATIALVNGTYPYTISKAGYVSVTGDAVVNGADIQVNKTLNQQEYTVTFTVVDNASNPIQGATIAINNETLTTNASGVATIALVNGTYPYTISKAGYVSVTGDAVVNGANIQVNETLTLQEYTFMLTVYGIGGPLEGATVEINGVTLTTNASGKVTIALVNGTYPYTVSKDGYVDVTSYVEINGEDIHIAFQMNPVTFATIFSAVYEGIPLQGVTILVNDEELTTDNSGNAVTQLPNGNYTYTATKEGYNSTEGSFVVDNASQTIIVYMTGIEGLENNLVKLYPNPVENTLTIECSNNEEVVIELYNGSGALVGTIKTDNATTTVDVETLGAGTYYMRIVGTSNTTVHKFIKR